MADEERFAQIVSIGAHDLSTPLATVYGFAKTLAKTDLEEPAARYVEMIEAASAQLRDLVDELSLVTRIERGRYSPALSEADSLELAREACAELGERVAVSGEGAAVQVDPDATSRASPASRRPPRATGESTRSPSSFAARSSRSHRF